MPTSISIRSLSKSFGSTTSFTLAVDNISLDINPGELFFLLGPSGCGKTTLLRMIAGFIDPTSGQILFDSRDITHTPPSKRNTGMVFQSYALWPHMTVEQNVAFGLSIRRTPAEERDRRIADALAAVKMADYAERKPNQLSGGQQQRVALARALVIRPDVLLLDEPLSNLDAKLRIELRSEIRRVCKETGITAVYVTHDQKEALSMADRVAVLDRGQLIQLGPPGELYRRPATKFVAEFLGETNFIPGRIRSSPKGEVPRSGGGAAEGAPSSTASTRSPSPLAALSSSSVSTNLITINTPAGPLQATNSPAPQPNTQAPAPKTQDAGSPTQDAAPRSWDILLSIRPEAFKLHAPDAPPTTSNIPHPTSNIPNPPPPNSLRGRILDSTYLGELVQFTIALPGDIQVKVASLNPALTPPRPGDQVTLSISPDDIVILPA